MNTKNPLLHFADVPNGLATNGTAAKRLERQEFSTHANNSQLSIGQLRVALLEDDPIQRDTICAWLQEGGATVSCFSTSAALMKEIQRESFDLMLLDWNLPDTSGDVVMQWLRHERNLKIPMIFITSRDSETDIVHGLSCGADDYMVKPVRRLELLARIIALLRRAAFVQPGSNQLLAAPYEFDLTHATVSAHGKEIALTHKEFEIAVFLFRHIGRVVSRGHLLETIWGRAANNQATHAIDAVTTRTIDSHISKLRIRMGLRPENGYRLSSIYGFGYRLEKTEALAAAVDAALELSANP
ncbi:MAG: response regulator transcription factor [Pseudomonadota bacterium]